MAKDGGSSSFLWLLLGLIAGIAATVAIYLFLHQAPQSSAPETAPQVQMETPPLPPEPAAPPVAAAPVEPAPVPAARPAPRQPDEQVNEDAAATGMTGPAKPQDDTAVNPTN